MTNRIYLIVLTFLLALTGCNQAISVEIDEYRLVSPPEVRDLVVYFEVIGGDSQEARSSRQQFAPSHQLIEPVYVNGSVVSIETSPQLDGDHIEIYIGKEKVYQAVLADLDGNASIKPWGAEGYWYIEVKELNENGDVKGNIVRDGQGLNIEMGYDESYDFAILYDTECISSFGGYLK